MDRRAARPSSPHKQGGAKQRTGSSAHTPRAQQPQQQQQPDRLRTWRTARVRKHGAQATVQSAEPEQAPSKYAGKMALSSSGSGGDPSSLRARLKDLRTHVDALKGTDHKKHKHGLVPAYVLRPDRASLLVVPGRHCGGASTGPAHVLRLNRAGQGTARA